MENTHHTPANGMIWHTESFWTSEQTTNIDAALVKFHGMGLTVPKNGTATITRGGLTRKYMLLDDILTTIRPALAKCGMYMDQHMAGDSVITRLVHESGQFVASKMHYVTWEGAGDINNLMKMGGGLSYLRRYAAAAICGLPADDDTDADGNDNMGYKNPKAGTGAAPAATASKAPAPNPKAAKTDSDDARPWLNLTDKTGKFTDNGAKAIAWIETGTGTVEGILKKYRVNKADMARLHEAEYTRAQWHAHQAQINQQMATDSNTENDGNAPF